MAGLKIVGGPAQMLGWGGGLGVPGPCLGAPTSQEHSPQATETLSTWQQVPRSSLYFTIVQPIYNRGHIGSRMALINKARSWSRGSGDPSSPSVPMDLGAAAWPSPVPPVPGLCAGDISLQPTVGVPADSGRLPPPLLHPPFAGAPHSIAHQGSGARPPLAGPPGAAGCCSRSGVTSWDHGARSPEGEADTRLQSC